MPFASLQDVRVESRLMSTDAFRSAGFTVFAVRPARYWLLFLP